MPDVTVRSDSVDVEHVMKQIRARIEEKRGVDYTEEQVRELATVRLEKFLDPKNLRSDLLDQFRRSRPALPEAPSEPAPVEAPYAVHADMVYETHRGALRLIRRLFRPILKLFFNPHPLIEVLDKQAQFNVDMIKRDQRRKIEMQLQSQGFDRSRAEWNVLYYEVLHNLVLETTRNAIELKNMRMRVEALASRLDFSERRVRALEGVVQYRPEVIRQPERPRSDRAENQPGETAEASSGTGVEESGTSGSGQLTPSESRRRRRRRRGRRGPETMSGSADAGAASAPDTADGAADEGDDLSQPNVAGAGDPDAQ